MTILIDYDNLDRLERQRGTRYVITRLLDVLGSWHTAWEWRVNCRLYGGWFDEDAFSRSAERLIPDLRRDFPRSVSVTSTEGAQAMLVVDLVHFAETTDQPLVVVSADDDLWPGIHFVLLRGARVIHVIPRRGRVDRERYRCLKTETYSQVVM